VVRERGPRPCGIPGVRTEEWEEVDSRQLTVDSKTERFPGAIREKRSLGTENGEKEEVGGIRGSGSVVPREGARGGRSGAFSFLGGGESSPD